MTVRQSFSLKYIRQQNHVVCECKVFQNYIWLSRARKRLQRWINILLFLSFGRAFLIRQWLMQEKSLQLWNSLNCFVVFFDFGKQTTEKHITHYPLHILVKEKVVDKWPTVKS